MPSASAHPPVEEYLQAIAFLTEEGGAVIQARLADRLHKTPAAISEVVIRLESDGYLIRHRRQIELTEEGATIATAVIRRHRLAERLLVDIVGLSWSAAHHEAGRYEHILSKEVEERLIAILDDPATCPHGNPIPGSQRATAARTTLSSLSQFGTGRQIRLERIPEDVEDDEANLSYLEEVGFVPGAVATVKEKAPDGVILVQIGERAAAFSEALARRLLVSEVHQQALVNSPAIAR
jgi:DtxR family Mn-dependent transcriptional regulator